MDNEQIVTVHSDSLSFSEASEVTEAVISDYPAEVVTTYDIQVVTTLDQYQMYSTIHQDLTNICGVLSIMLVFLFILFVVRYINKIYHYLFH